MHGYAVVSQRQPAVACLFDFHGIHHPLIPLGNIVCMAIDIPPPPLHFSNKRDTQFSPAFSPTSSLSLAN